MDSKDSKDLDQLFEVVKKQAENLTYAITRIVELRQASIANVHLTMALMSEVGGDDPKKFDSLAGKIRTMQKALESDAGSEISRKYLGDFAEALAVVAKQLSDQSPHKAPVDPEGPFAEFLRKWTSDTSH